MTELHIRADARPTRTAIFVLGMHRSGTSALARTLSHLGAALPRHLLPAGLGNETGHWEPELAVRLHDRLLDAAGTSVNDLCGPPGSWFTTEAASGFVDEMQDLFVSEFGDAPLCVLKDPRTALVFPLWRRALQQLDVRCLPVVITRHPVEVARSLAARQTSAAPGQAWPLERGGLLWLRYALAAERYTRDMTRAFCLYPDLLEDWRTVMAQLSHDLGVSWPRPTAAAEADIDAFLSSHLRHQREAGNLDAHQGIWSSLIAPVYDELRRARAGRQPTASPFDAAQQVFDGVCATVRSADVPSDADVPAPDAVPPAVTREHTRGRKRLGLVGTAFRRSGHGDGGGHLRGIVDGATKAGYHVTLVDAYSRPNRGDAVPDSPAALASLDVQHGAPCTPPLEPGYLRSTVALFRHLRAQEFDAILFQDRDGLAFASIIARQCGLAFEKTAIGVVAFGSSRWLRECDHQFPASLVTIATEYLEQQAIALADVVILPSRDVAEWMSRAGWKPRTTYQLPEPSELTAPDASADVWATVLQRLDTAEPRSVDVRASGPAPHDVTVVITTFEQPALLDQNLEALTRQTDREFSVVVVDDGSRSEAAVHYLSDVEDKYRALNLRVIRQENRYLGAARNAGIRAATTEFVILLDDDNVAFPEMVGTLRRAICAAEADVVTCGIRHFHDTTGRPPADMSGRGPDQLFSAGPLLLGAVHNCLGDASGIYRKAVFDAVGYFHEVNGAIFEDWQLHLRVVAAGRRLVSVPEPLVWYRVRPDGLLRTTRRYDNARVISETIDDLSCAMLQPLAEYLMGSEAEQVRLNGEIARLTTDLQQQVEIIRAAAAANAAALTDAATEARRHAHSLQVILDARTRSAEDAAGYAHSLEQAVAELQASNAAATEYAASLERARAEAEAYAKRLEVEYRKLLEAK